MTNSNDSQKTCQDCSLEIYVKAVILKAEKRYNQHEAFLSDDDFAKAAAERRVLEWLTNHMLCPKCHQKM
jgi:NADH pyrophosphatase NudC (nudix superfamily)